MTVCNKEKKEKPAEKRKEFMERMSKCAQDKGAKDFDELQQKCEDADVLKKMEECKEKVTSEMMAERPVLGKQPGQQEREMKEAIQRVTMRDKSRLKHRIKELQEGKDGC